MVLLLVCLAVDAQRRVVAGDVGKALPEFATPTIPSLLAPLPAGLRTAAAGLHAGLHAGLWYAGHDVLAIVASFAHRPGSDRREDLARGQAMGQAILAARAGAMAATTPGPEPRSRRWFALGSLVVGGLGLAATLGWGSVIAREIGAMLLMSGDHPFFAGLLDGLSSWWASLGLGDRSC